MPDKTKKQRGARVSDTANDRVIYHYSITGPTMPLPDIEKPDPKERPVNPPNAVKRRG